MEISEVLKHCPNNHITALVGENNFNFKNSVDGLIKSNLTVLDFLGGKENLDKIKDSLKMVLYEKNIYYKLNDLSINDVKKVQLASKFLNKSSVLFLEYFEKGFNNKEISYFKKLFKKIRKYDISVIVLSNDISWIASICDRACVIEKGHIVNVFNDINWFNDDLLKYFDELPILKFVRSSRKYGYLINETFDLNELMKSIYRAVK